MCRPIRVFPFYATLHFHSTAFQRKEILLFTPLYLFDCCSCQVLLRLAICKNIPAIGYNIPTLLYMITTFWMGPFSIMSTFTINNILMYGTFTSVKCRWLSNFFHCSRLLLLLLSLSQIFKYFFHAWNTDERWIYFSLFFLSPSISLLFIYAWI